MLVALCIASQFEFSVSSYFVSKMMKLLEKKGEKLLLDCDSNLKSFNQCMIVLPKDHKLSL